MDNPEAGSRPPAGTPGGPAETPATTLGEQPPPPPTGAWPTGQQPAAYGGYPPRRPTNGLAIAALVVGGVSLVSCPLIGAVAIYLGTRARKEIRTTGEDGDPFALAGVVLGWCALALGLLSAVVFAISLLGFVAINFRAG